MFREGCHATDAESEQARNSRQEAGGHHQEACRAGQCTKERKTSRGHFVRGRIKFFILLFFLNPAARGAPEWSEAAEGAAEEAAPADEGEGPAAEWAQPSRVGPQQAGGPLSRAAEAQQDPEGSVRVRTHAHARTHTLTHRAVLIWAICCRCFDDMRGRAICPALQGAPSAGVVDQADAVVNSGDRLKHARAHFFTYCIAQNNVFFEQ